MPDPKLLEAALKRADRLSPPDKENVHRVARCKSKRVQLDEDLKTSQAMGVLASEVRRLRRELRHALYGPKR